MRPTTVFEHCLWYQENVLGDWVKFAGIFKLKRGSCIPQRKICFGNLISLSGGKWKKEPSGKLHHPNYSFTLKYVLVIHSTNTFRSQIYRREVCILKKKKLLVTNLNNIFVCFLLGNYPASGFYMRTFRNTLSVPSS